MKEDEEIYYEGKIHPSFRWKSLLKIIIMELVIILPFAIIASYIYLSFVIYDINGIILSFYNFFNMVIGFLVIISIIFLGIMYFYYTHEINSFSFKLKESYLIIDFGFLRITRMIIPYNQIQNISITCGLLDRIFKLNTIRIETSGASGYPYKFGSGPEGYIPGVKAERCVEFEGIIMKMIKGK